MDKVKTVLVSLLSSAIKNNGTQNYQLSKAEWVELYEEAIAHQVDSIIFSQAYRLLLQAEELSEIAEAWKRRSLFTVMHHKTQCMIVPEILSVFNEANISALMLKGYVLKDLYSNPDMRLMCDLDFFIKVSDWDKAAKALESLGYKEDIAIEHNCTASFKHPTGISIELHRTLAEDTLFPHIKTLEKALWDNAVTYYVEGQRILVPAKDDLLFYLLLHLAKHFAESGFGLRQLTDLTLFIEKNKAFLSTDVLNDYIELFELGQIISHILKLCAELLDLDFDLPLQNIPQESYNYFVRFVFESGVFGYKTFDSIIDNNYLAFLKHNLNHNSSHSMYKLKRIFFPPATLMNIKYGYARKYPILLPLAWAHRTFNTLGKGLSGSAKRFSKPKDTDKLKIKIAYLKQFNLIDRHNSK